MRRLAEHVEAIEWSRGPAGRRRRCRASLDGDDSAGAGRQGATTPSRRSARLVVDDVVRHAGQPDDRARPAAMSTDSGPVVRAPAEPIHYRVSHRTTYQYAPADDRRVHAGLPAAPADGAAGRRAGRGRGRRRRPTSAPSTSTCSATGCCRSASTGPTSADAARRERGRRRARRPAGPGEPWEVVAMRVGELRGGDALVGAPVRRAARRTSPLDRHGAALRALAEEAFTPAPARRRRRPGPVPPDLRDVRVRPVVHRRLDAAVGGAGGAAGRVPGLRPPGRPGACARSGSPPATSAGTSRPTRRRAGSA